MEDEDLYLKIKSMTADGLGHKELGHQQPWYSGIDLIPMKYSIVHKENMCLVIEYTSGNWVIIGLCNR